MGDQIINTRITADIADAESGIRTVKRSIQDLSKESETTSKNMNVHAQYSSMAMSELEKSIQGVTMRVMYLGMAATFIAAPFVAAFAIIKKGIEAVDELKISTIQIAAQITTMQGPKNVAEHYKAATAYAGALALKLQEVDANSFANYENLLAMTTTMTSQGVLLDVNNKKQVESFTSISNAIAMMTAGQNQGIQFHQEIRALMTGEVTQGSMLARQIDDMAKASGLYKGGLKEIVTLGKQHGDLLERLSPFLVGINAASGDIAQTWQAVTSSAATAISMVMRSGFDTVFKDAVKWGGEAVAYLKEHAELIGGTVREGWEFTKEVVARVAFVLQGMGVVLKEVILPAFKDIWLVASATEKAIESIPYVLSQAPGVVTALGIAAYYAVGGIAGMTLAYESFVAVVTASMTSNPLGWIALGIGAVYLAAKPAVQALDEMVYAYTGLNVTGEAFYNDQMRRDAAATKSQEDLKVKLRWMHNEGGLKVNMTYAGIIETPKIPATPTPADSEAVDALVKLTGAQDSWEQKALSSGKVTDELAAKTAALTAEYNTLIEDTKKAAGPQASQARAFIKEQFEAINANNLLADTKKGQKALDEADAAQSLSAFRNNIATERALLQEQLANKVIDRNTYHARYMSTIESESKQELGSLATQLEKAKSNIADIVSNGGSAGAYKEAFAGLVKVQTAIDAVIDKTTKLKGTAGKENTQWFKAELDRTLALKKEIAAIQATNSAFAASQVGTDSLTGAVTDPYARDTAMAEDALKTKLAYIETERVAKIKAAQDTSDAIGAVNAINKAFDQQSADERIATAQKVAAITVAAEQTKYSDLTSFASKAFPKITSFQTAAALLTKKYAKEEDGVNEDGSKKFKLSTQGKMSMTADYFAFAGQGLSDLAASQDQSSRAGFESAKAYNLGAAAMSTAAAVIGQLSGPDAWTPVAWARAVMAGVLGLAQVVSIAGTSYGGGGSVNTSVPAGSFGAGGGGGATGSGGGGSVSAPLQSVQDSMSAKELDRVANSMDGAATAMAKASDNFLSISEMFKSGIMTMLMQIVPGRFTQTPADMSGVGTNISNFLNLDKKSMGAFFKMDVGTLWNQTMSGLFGGGWGTSGAGLTGQLKGGQFQTGSYVSEHKNGGLFGSSGDRTTYGSNVDAAFTKGMSQFFDGIKQDMLIGAKVFGMSAQTTEAGFANVNTPRFQVATAGRKPEDIQKDWEAQVQAASDALAATIPGLTSLALGGEKLTDTYGRLANAMVNVNDSLNLIGVSAIPATGAISDTAYRLQELMGGADKFTTAVDNYFTGMFTTQEQAAAKAAQAQRQVTVAFNEMGIAAPTTKEEFRTLVDGLNLASDSGARTFAALMDVSTAFATVQDQLIALRDATATFTNDLTARTMVLNGIDPTLFNLRISQEAEMKKALLDGMDTGALAIVQQGEWAAAVAKATGVVTDSITKLIDAAKKAVTDMIDAQINIANAMKTIMTGPLAGLTPEQQYNQAQAKFAALQAGPKDLAYAQALPEAVNNLLNASKTYNASGMAYQTDLANVLAAMNAAIGGTGDPTLETIESQLKVLQDIRTALTSGALVTELGAGGTLASLIGTWNAATAAELLSRQKTAADQTYQRDLGIYNTARDPYIAGTIDAAAFQKTIDPLAGDYTAATGKGNTYAAANPTGITIADNDARMKTKAGPIAQALQNGNPPYNAAWDIGYFNGGVRKGGGSGTLDWLDYEGWRQLAAGTVNWSQYGLPAFANGGISSGPSIFGEAGPEAAVPLPDGRSIPVTLSGSADNGKVIDLLERMERRLEKVESHAAAGVVVQQSGFTRVIEVNERQDKRLQGVENKTKLQAAR